MKNNTFYVTTTIPYVNDKPHIGFALEITQADVLARFNELIGKEVFFNTGTDEHGQKIYQKALESHRNPQDYVDEYAAKFNRLKEALNLSYNNFIRTTDPHHIEAAKEFWTRCQASGDIYKDKQRIKYCVGCELEKTESELDQNGNCPIHPNLKIEVLEEENYFFRFSKYQKPLLNFYRTHPNFVFPQYRYTEIKKFVEAGLKDFSISRLKEKMPWGIEVPGDEKHVMYVWFDALINYISALGWPKDQEKFSSFWGSPEQLKAIQVAGKDNLRQQTAIWQAMLMSAGLPNSKQILIHGFITANGQKISKSLGNVIDPFAVVKKYGTDPTRYYLLKEIHPFKDGDFSYQRFEEIYNADLANGLGNLVQRAAKLCESKGYSQKHSPSKQIAFLIKQGGFTTHIECFEFNLALEEIWRTVKQTDILINQSEPWRLTESAAAAVLDKVVENILDIAYALKPFLPETSQKIETIFTADKIQAPKEPLFPRL